MNCARSVTFSSVDDDEIFSCSSYALVGFYKSGARLHLIYTQAQTQRLYGLRHYFERSNFKTWTSQRATHKKHACTVKMRRNEIRWTRANTLESYYRRKKKKKCQAEVEQSLIFARFFHFRCHYYYSRFRNFKYTFCVSKAIRILQHFSSQKKTYNLLDYTRERPNAQFLFCSAPIWLLCCFVRTSDKLTVDAWSQDHPIQWSM